MQCLGKEAHRIDLMQPGKLQHILADQIRKVPTPPALRLCIAVGQSRLGKTAALQRFIRLFHLIIPKSRDF